MPWTGEGMRALTSPLSFPPDPSYPAALSPWEIEEGVPDILQDFPVRAPREVVFRAITEPKGLDTWWTLRSEGSPVVGQDYRLDFGPSYLWRARVKRAVRPETFELEFTEADSDWNGSVLTFHLEESSDGTQVRFSHTGWPTANGHYRISCHCWAMYLRLLRRYLEHGEVVDYERRLSV